MSGSQAGSVPAAAPAYYTHGSNVLGAGTLPTNLPCDPEEVTSLLGEATSLSSDGGGGARDPRTPPNPASPPCPRDSAFQR